MRNCKTSIGMEVKVWLSNIANLVGVEMSAELMNQMHFPMSTKFVPFDLSRIRRELLEDIVLIYTAYT